MLHTCGETQSEREKGDCVINFEVCQDEVLTTHTCLGTLRKANANASCVCGPSLKRGSSLAQVRAFS